MEPDHTKPDQQLELEWTHALARRLKLGLMGSCSTLGFTPIPGSDFGKRLHYFWVGLSVSGITKALHNMGSTGPDLKSEKPSIL